MGELRLEGHELVLDGPPLYDLPKKVTPELVAALFASPPGDPFFIGEICRSLTASSKRRLRVACQELGDDAWKAYCTHAVKWASVVNNDNRWHLADFRPVYEAEIGAWWIHTVIVTDANIRFATTARGIFTFPEFQLIYGQNVLDYIEKYRQQRSKELGEVVRHITSPLVRKRVRLADDDGNLLTKELTVLESLDPSFWRLPRGTHLLEVDE